MGASGRLHCHGESGMTVPEFHRIIAGRFRAGWNTQQIAHFVSRLIGGTIPEATIYNHLSRALGDV